MLRTLILHPFPIPIPPMSCMAADDVAMGAMLLIVAMSVDMPVLVDVAIDMSISAVLLAFGIDLVVVVGRCFDHG